MSELHKCKYCGAVTTQPDEQCYKKPESVSDESESWKQYKDEQQERRRKRLPIRVAEINSLSEVGVTIRKLTEYQYRLNEAIDVYPIHNRYHCIKTNKRGSYKSVKELLKYLT